MTTKEQIAFLKHLKKSFNGDESTNEILDEALYYLTDRPDDFDGYTLESLLEEATDACINSLESSMDELRELLYKEPPRRIVGKTCEVSGCEC